MFKNNLRHMTDGAKACIKSQGKRRILKVTFVSKKSKRRGVITKHILNEMKNLSALCVDQ